MRAVIFVTFALLAGCASSLERVQAVRDAAPDWYAARKVEISGDGYPSIGDIPFVTEETRPGQQLGLSERDTIATLRALLADPRSNMAEESPAEMRIWATTVRRAVEGRIPAPDFLTDEDVAALKAIFDRPRGRL